MSKSSSSDYYSSNPGRAQGGASKRLFLPLLAASAFCSVYDFATSMPLLSYPAWTNGAKDAERRMYRGGTPRSNLAKRDSPSVHEIKEFLNQLKDWAADLDGKKLAQCMKLDAILLNHYSLPILGLALLAYAMAPRIPIWLALLILYAILNFAFMIKAVMVLTRCYKGILLEQPWYHKWLGRLANLSTFLKIAAALLATLGAMFAIHSYLSDLKERRNSRPDHYGSKPPHSSPTSPARPVQYPGGTTSNTNSTSSSAPSNHEPETTANPFNDSGANPRTEPPTQPLNPAPTHPPTRTTIPPTTASAMETGPEDIDEVRPAAEDEKNRLQRLGQEAV